MKHGFIKVAAATTEVKVAECGFNTEAVIATMKQAEAQHIKILCLPEMCITGYTCADLFLQDTLLQSAKSALLKIAAESGDMLTAVGLPLKKDGKLYNCAAVIHRGKILGIVPKSYIPNYAEYYELRHFTPAPDFNSEIMLGGEPIPFGTKLLFCCSSLENLVVALEICEDLWTPSPPSVGHANAGATVILNLSASNEVIGKADYRRVLVSGHSGRLVTGYVYCSAGMGESTTDLVFGAHNLVGENGTILAESRFQNGITPSELDLGRLAYDRQRMTDYPQCENREYQRIPFVLKEDVTELTRHVAWRPFVPDVAAEREQRCEEILNIQTQGLKKRLEHTKANSLVVGISGGLDSTLALLIAVRAMKLLERPISDVIAVTMPCFGTTKRTRCNAEQLAEHLDVTLKVVDITAAVLQHFEDIDHDLERHDVVFENVQARERTQVLMDIANQYGGLVVGTGDMSELALGWATYNGDHMSMYTVNCSVPKTLVRYLVEYEALRTEEKSLKTVLLDVLDTPVSPELLPVQEDGEISQRTEDLVGPYELHDFFLYYTMRWGFRPTKIFRLANYAFQDRPEYGEALILKWLKVFYRRFFAQQYKRSCIPDGPKTGTVALSPRGDWRMPSDACAEIWLKELDEISVMPEK